MPTVAEAANLPGYEATTWQGLLFPANTPKPSVERMQREVAKVLGVAETATRLRDLGYEPVGSTPEEAREARHFLLMHAAAVTAISGMMGLPFAGVAAAALPPNPKSVLFVDACTLKPNVAKVLFRFVLGVNVSPS